MNKRSPHLERRDVVNVAAAQRDFRRNRFAPVDVVNVCAGLGTAPLGQRLVAVADLQHRLVTTKQLRDLGVSPSAVSRWVRSGRLCRLHRGVFLLTANRPTRLADLLAAVLSAGAGAVLGGRQALELWGVVEQGSRGPINVLTPSYRRPRAGLELHRARSLHPDDCAALGHIPLTAPARSLLDYAVGADPGALESAISEARAEKLLRRRDLERLRARTHGHHGWRQLNRILDAEGEPDFSRREAERRLFNLVRDAGLPLPRRNVRIGGYEADLYWPEYSLVVEVDSYAYHSSRRAFEQDRRKQADLMSQGLEVLRFTWRQITGEPVWTIARIATRLGALAPGRG